MYNEDGGPLSDPFLINSTMVTADLNGDREYVFCVAAATSAGLGPKVETSSKTAVNGTHYNIWQNEV